MSLPVIPIDKANHIIYGAALFAIVGGVAAVVGAGQWSRLIGLVAVVTVGVAKEVSDAVLNRRALEHGLPAPHGVEYADLAATVAGGAGCWLAAVMTDSLV